MSKGIIVIDDIPVICAECYRAEIHGDNLFCSERQRLRFGGSMEHELKIYPKYFEDVISGKKKFEIRKNDRKFAIGDVLILKEWDNIKYSGRLVRAEVIYLLSDNFIGIQPGYVVMGIKKLEN